MSFFSPVATKRWKVIALTNNYAKSEETILGHGDGAGLDAAVEAPLWPASRERESALVLVLVQVVREAELVLDSSEPDERAESVSAAVTRAVRDGESWGLLGGTSRMVIVWDMGRRRVKGRALGCNWWGERPRREA